MATLGLGLELEVVGAVADVVGTDIEADETAAEDGAGSPSDVQPATASIRTTVATPTLHMSELSHDRPSFASRCPQAPTRSSLLPDPDASPARSGRCDDPIQPTPAGIVAHMTTAEHLLADIAAAALERRGREGWRQRPGATWCHVGPPVR